MIEGGADFQRPDLQITSDKVDYNWKTKVAVFKGNVKVMQSGLAPVGSDIVKYNVETKEFIN
jgi:lipopolysaccharide export system protein LptA